MNRLAQEPISQISTVYIENANLPELELVEIELLKSINDLSSPIKEMCHYIITSGGKRLRPKLMFNCGQCFGPINDEMVKAAAAAELIHLASLVHDDILDNSNLRHRKTTLNFTYGNHTSVLVGDCLFAKAFQLLSSSHIYNGLEYMVQAIQHMCEGEILQASGIESASFSIQEYYKKIEKKTARLISACCKTGAALIPAGQKFVYFMEMYGLYLGYAYQIIDDILDLQGSREKLGKPVFNDLLQGNITLPIILLLENDEYLKYVNAVIENKIVNEEIKSAISSGLKETGALNKAFTIAKEFCNKAQICLEQIPESPYRQILLALPSTLLNRYS